MRDKCACVRATCVRACYERACVRACCVHVYILHAHMKNNAVPVVRLSKQQRRHKRHCCADDSWILDDLSVLRLSGSTSITVI